MADPSFPSITGWPGLDTLLAHFARWEELSQPNDPPPEPGSDGHSGFLQARGLPAGPELAIAEAGVALVAGYVIGWPVLLPVVATMVLLPGHDLQEQPALPAPQPVPLPQPAKHGQPAAPGVLEPGTASPRTPDSPQPSTSPQTPASPDKTLAPPNIDWPAIGHRVTYAEDITVAGKEGEPPESAKEPDVDQKVDDKDAIEKKKGQGRGESGAEPTPKEGGRVIRLIGAGGSPATASRPRGSVLTTTVDKERALKAERERLLSAPASGDRTENARRQARVDELTQEIDRLRPWISHLQKPGPHGTRSTQSSKAPLQMVRAGQAATVERPATSAELAVSRPPVKGEPALAQLPTRAQSAAMSRRCVTLLTAQDKSFKAAIAKALKEEGLRAGPTEDATAYRIALMREEWLRQKMLQRLKDLAGRDDELGRFARTALQDKDTVKWLVRNDLWPGPNAKLLYPRQVEASRLANADPGHTPPAMPDKVQARVKAAMEYLVRRLEGEPGTTLEAQLRYLRDTTGLTGDQLDWLIRKHPDWFEGSALADPGLTEPRYAQVLEAAHALALRPANMQVTQLPPSARDRELLSFVIDTALPALKARYKTFQWQDLSDLAFEHDRAIQAMNDWVKAMRERITTH